MNTPTLHQALDIYQRSIEANGGGQLRPYDQHRLVKVSVLKKHAADMPLESLAFAECSSLVDHWRNRPDSRTGKPFARASAMQFVAEFVRFLQWMDSSEEFNWRLPRAFDLLNRSVKMLDSDHASRLRRRATYTVSELSLLKQYANEADRLLLYLSLNCGMGAAGLLRLKTSDFHFDHQHELAERIGLGTDERHAFLRVTRPRTGQFFEWILWPETIDVVRRAVYRSVSFNVENIFLTGDGRSVYGEDRNDFGTVLRKRFGRLVARVQKDQAEFPSLPLGSLRRSMSDLIRCKAGSEIAGLYLGHGGTPDTLNCMYRPFGGLHRSLIESRRDLEPVFRNGGSNNG